MPAQVMAAAPNLSSYLKSLKGHTADTAAEQLAA